MAVLWQFKFDRLVTTQKWLSCNTWNRQSCDTPWSTVPWHLDYENSCAILNRHILVTPENWQSCNIYAKTSRPMKWNPTNISLITSNNRQSCANLDFFSLFPQKLKIPLHKKLNDSPFSSGNWQPCDIWKPTVLWYLNNISPVTPKKRKFLCQPTNNNPTSPKYWQSCEVWKRAVLWC